MYETPQKLPKYLTTMEEDKESSDDCLEREELQV
jgi:hypothetical protein